MKYLLLNILFTSLFTIWGVTVHSSILFIILLIVWINMMLYSYKKIEHRSTLFAFGVAFFVFLMGREFLEQYSLIYPDVKFSDNINNHLYRSLLLALLGTWGAFSLFSKKSNINSNLSNIDVYYLAVARKKIKQLFFIILPFAIIYRLIIAIIIAKLGYHEQYVEFANFQSSNLLLNLLNKIAIMLPVTFCCFIATLPTKQEFKNILIAYLGYLCLTLLGGQRGAFLLGILLIFIFLVYMQGIRPNENWFKRKYFNYSLIIIPLIICFSSFIGSWRVDRKINGFFDSFYVFFNDQGVTSYVVKRAYEYENEIPKDIYVFQFLHSGILAAVLDIPVYNGNTVDHATKGGNFAHALSYVILGDKYLLGVGTGSSFVAELFYDFGYIGVYLGAFLYGILLVSIYRTNSLLKRTIVFIIITELLWACRSSFVGFLVLLLTPSVIMIGLYIFWLSYKKPISKIGYRESSQGFI